MLTKMHFWSYLAQFFLEWKIFQIKLYRKTNTHFMFSNFFFKLRRLGDKLEKYYRAGQVTDNNMAANT